MTIDDVISGLEREVDRLKKQNRRLRDRLRAVKHYHSISESMINRAVRLGYGSTRRQSEGQKT
jgi:hypothetical protein